MRFSKAYVTLASVHFERLVSFYAGLLGQAPQIYSPQRYAEWQLPGLCLGIFKPRFDHGAEFGGASSGAMSLCIEVIDLEEAIAHLTQLGYPPAGPILVASHGREIYAYDPDGNRLILYQSI